VCRAHPRAGTYHPPASAQYRGMKSATGRQVDVSAQVTMNRAEHPLCGRAVDMVIYGVAAALTLQAALLFRDPERLIPPLPPPRAIDGVGAGALDARGPPRPIMRVVEETIAAMQLCDGVVTTVLVPGTSAKSAGSVSSSAGARIGIPLQVVECLGFDIVRRSPLKLGWHTPLGQDLYATLCPSPDEVAWVIAHECAHLKHEDGVTRALSLGWGLFAYHATTKLLWWQIQRGSGRRLPSSVFARGFLVVTGPILTCCSQIMLARYQEHAADAAASALSLGHARGGLAHLERCRAYRSFRRDHMADSNINATGDMINHWITHPSTADRLARIEAQISKEHAGGMGTDGVQEGHHSLAEALDLFRAAASAAAAAAPAPAAAAAPVLVQ
jgi:hypothetical protein